MGRGGGSGSQHGSGQHGPGRGGNHPDCHLHGPGAPRGHVLFKDKVDYDLANNGRDYTRGHYSYRRGLSELEYEARQNAIFQPGVPGDTKMQARGAGYLCPPSPCAARTAGHRATPRSSIPGPSRPTMAASSAYTLGRWGNYPTGHICFSSAAGSTTQRRPDCGATTRWAWWCRCKAGSGSHQHGG
jgi:hypothetical protein